MTASSLTVPLQHISEPTGGEDSDDSDSGSDPVIGAMHPPDVLKGYTVIEVLTPEMEFEREG